MKMRRMLQWIAVCMLCAAAVLAVPSVAMAADDYEYMHYFKIHEDMMNAEFYYTTDGITLNSVQKGEVVGITNRQAIAYFIKVREGYMTNKALMHQLNAGSFSDTNFTSGIVADIATVSQMWVYDETKKDNIALSITTARDKAIELGCDYENHYSAENKSQYYNDDRYVVFKVNASPVAISVQYDSTYYGSLNGSRYYNDEQKYRHPDVTEEDYKNYLTEITVIKEIPTRRNYTFTGWKFNGNIYQPGDTLSIKDIWKAGNTEAVTYTFEAQWARSTGNITITKDFKGLSATEIPSNFSLQLNSGSDQYALYLQNAEDNEDGSYTWTISSVPTGVYSVTETDYEVTGYSCESDTQSISINVTPNNAGSGTVTNTYTPLPYTVTWKNEDGTVLKTDTVNYGETPVYTGETPEKAATAQYTYTFAGWTPEIATVTGDATYKATYTETTNEYTIRFENEDGTELQSGKVAYGETPVYTGETPTKASTAQYTYTFTGWDPEIKAVSGDATYTAQYESTVKA